MIDFVPIEDYSYFFYQFILIICVITLFHTLVLKGNEAKAINFNRIFAIFILFATLLYIGLRPLNGVFVDMTTYAHSFNQFKNGMDVTVGGDLGFDYFMKLSSQTMPLEAFFFLCAIIYIVPLYIACKNWFPNYYFFPFLILVGSFSFWTYGVNGLRNGMATSLFILALSYVYKNKNLAVLFFTISILFHKSMLLLLLSYIITYFVTDTKKYYFFWFLAIVLSLVMGGFWESLFASLGFGDDKLSSYLTTSADKSQFSSTGFRFDFLIYSAAPLAFAYYYIFIKGFKSIEYNRILHTYIIANAFWIMVIRANFSNRFAYLSWFLMGIVIAYPLLKKEMMPNQFKKIGIITLCYYGFTYAMFNYYYA